MAFALRSTAPRLWHRTPHVRQVPISNHRAAIGLIAPIGHSGRILRSDSLSDHATPDLRLFHVLTVSLASQIFVDIWLLLFADTFNRPHAMQISWSGLGCGVNEVNKRDCNNSNAVSGQS